MPRFCGVIGCGNRGERDSKSFFRLPANLSQGGIIKVQLSKLRRQKWLFALRRADLTELKKKYLWICEDHFISGRPADLMDENNPDWIPNQKLGYENVSQLPAAHFSDVQKCARLHETIVKHISTPYITFAIKDERTTPVHVHTDIQKEDIDNLFEHNKYMQKNAILKNTKVKNYEG